MAVFQKFDCFVQNLGLGVHNMSADTFKVMLTDTLPVHTNTLKANITEIAAGNGYMAGGTAMTGVSWTQPTAGKSQLAGSDVVFTASGGPIAQFRYAVLYDATAAGGPLIGWWDYGAEVNVTAGNTFSVLPANVADVLDLS